MGFNSNDPSVLFHYLFERTNTEFSSFQRKRISPAVEVFWMNYGQCRLKRVYNERLNDYRWCAVGADMESPITDQLIVTMLEKQFYAQNPYDIDGPDQTLTGKFVKSKKDHPDFGGRR